MRFWPLALSGAPLWKRITSRLTGAHRVGGTGPNHEGSRWIGVASAIEVELEKHGLQRGLVLSRTPNQLKMFAPGLGTFAVHPSRASPVDEPLEWNRREADATSPAVGSLVNVRRDGDVSMWTGRLACELGDKEPDETVTVERGCLARRPQSVEVEAREVLGPHLPTKIKTLSGQWVKDALRRRDAAPSPLDALVPQSELERTAPALEWPRFLSAQEQHELSVFESNWFQRNGAHVRSIAHSCAARLRLRGDAARDVESEAMRGALAAIRLWRRAPDAQRALTRAKIERDEPGTDAFALRDDDLLLRRASWRAFASARAGALTFGALPDLRPNPGTKPMTTSLSPASSAMDSLAPLIETAQLSPAARCLLGRALRLGFAGHLDLEQNGALWPPDEAEAVVSELRELGATHATPETLPGMWLFVRKRLQEAKRNEPQDDPMEKSVVATRALSLLKAVNSLDHDHFHEWEHPRGHGRFIQKLFFHHEPVPMFFTADGGAGGSAASLAHPFWGGGERDAQTRAHFNGRHEVEILPNDQAAVDFAFQHFGFILDKAEWGQLIGATDGAKVTVMVMGDQVRISQHNSPLFSRLSWTITAPESSVEQSHPSQCTLEMSLVNKKPGLSRGISPAPRMLAYASKKAADMGFRFIEAWAVGEYQDPALPRVGAFHESGTGYSRWPQLGFDGDIPMGLRHRFSSNFQPVTKLRALLDQPGGFNEWILNGGSVDVQFNLASGSYSRQKLVTELLRKGVKI